jgi:hypothetical protein
MIWVFFVFWVFLSYGFVVLRWWGVSWLWVLVLVMAVAVAVALGLGYAVEKWVCVCNWKRK